LIYLLASSGPKTSSHLLPWSHWAQLGLDGLLFVLWLAATADSPYSCSGLCNACSGIDEGYGYYAWAGSLVCQCAEAGDITARRVVKKALEDRATSAAAKAYVKAGKIAAKQGFDALMM
jgi:hypothetical protein